MQKTYDHTHCAFHENLEVGLSQFSVQKASLEFAGSIRSYW